MATAFAFLGMLLVSMLVALLAVLQLGDFFLANDEFILVIAGVAAFTILSLAVLAIAYAVTPNAGLIAGVALVLAIVAVAPVALTGLIARIADRSTNPYTLGVEKTAITLELLIPALLAVLVQWGLVRRRWLRSVGESDLTRWPWFTTVVAALVILNPFGLAYLQSTLQHSATDSLWALTASITAGVLCALLIAAWIECYIRDRILNRHSAAAVPDARDATADPFLQEARDVGNR
jgi:hypothetical protein